MLQMHRVLESLGIGYDANRHWTSKLRLMAGFSSYNEADDAKATFTFPDKQGDFTRLLAEQGFEAAEVWGPNPTYHIDVKGTKEKMTAPFYISSAEFERVCVYRCII
jgi:hypothetical protein